MTTKGNELFRLDDVVDIELDITIEHYYDGITINRPNAIGNGAYVLDDCIDLLITELQKRQAIIAKYKEES